MHQAAQLGPPLQEKGARLPRIGGMATMPSRAHTIGTVLASILPQLDRLFIYFDGYEAVPHAFTSESKIVPLAPARFGNLAGSGKFLGARLHHDPCLYFCFDDDILYPPDYVEVLTRALYRHRLRAAVGFHAATLRPPFRSYAQDRDIVHFSCGCRNDSHVDMLGTGTMAFHTGHFRFDPDKWRFKDMCDLMTAIEATRQSVPRISIRRPVNYLVPLEQNQIDSTAARLGEDDSRQSEVMREALRSWALSWHDVPGEEIARRRQRRRTIIIDTTHGVVPDADPKLHVHRNLLDAGRFAAYLRRRKHAYVPLAACLEGEGDALTIDDATVAGADAARLARAHGHAVTLFINGYNIAEGKCYALSRLNAALDATGVGTLIYDGSTYDLRLARSTRDFRAYVKQKLLQLRSEAERESFVSDIGRLLGIEEIIVPQFLRPIHIADLLELAALGVDIQNHGWTHITVGAVPFDEHAADIRRGREWLHETCGVRADLFAAPNGASLPLWEASGEYRAWLLLDSRRPLGMLAPGLYNRRTLTEALLQDQDQPPTPSAGPSEMAPVGAMSGEIRR
jgi:hypothetical protein